MLWQEELRGLRTQRFAHVQDLARKAAAQERQRKKQATRHKWLDHVADQENRLYHRLNVPAGKAGHRLEELRRLLRA